MMRDTERIVQKPANPSFLTRFNQQRRKVGKPIDILDDAWRFERESSPSIPEGCTISAPNSFPQPQNHPQLCAQIREIAQEEAKCIFTPEIDKSLLKAAEDALFDTF